MNLRSVDLNLLVALDALLAERSVTRAGKRLGLSQPATSNALARLRALLGDPLLVRAPGGMRPTPRAKALAAPLKQALAGLERALAETPRFDPATTRTTVTIMMTDYAALVVLPVLERELRTRAPGIELRVTGVAPFSTLQADVDLAIARLPQATPPFHKRRLFRDRLATIVRAGHPRLVRGKLGLAEFTAADHVLVSFGTPGPAVIDQVLHERGLARRIALYVSHFVVVPFVVRATDLVATIPERIARSFASDGGLVVIEPPMRLPAFEMDLVWHERNHQDPAQIWLRELVAGLFDS